MTIKFNGAVHEFSFNTAYFMVTPVETFEVRESEREIRYWQERLPERLREELRKVGGGIIWWRIEPEICHAQIGCDPDKDPQLWTDEEKALGEHYFCWKGYARFATSPELHEDVMTRLVSPQELYQTKCAELRDQAIKSLTRETA